MTEPSRADYEVVVIGAGPGGLAAGVKLQQAGITDFAILERADDVGGSWHENTYPGLGVDIPSIAYQYSFARNANWSRFFAKGAEVKEYHVAVAKKYGLYDHLRVGTNVVSERWNDENHWWEMHLADGSVITARFVISAVGAFVSPKEDPGIAGVKSFGGKIQRPSSWDHSYDHTGKRVGIIGTGASSVQITPAIAGEVGELSVFQRTPVWCLPKPDFATPRWYQGMMKIPGLQATVSGIVLVGVDLVLRVLIKTPLPLAERAMGSFDSGAIRAYRTFLRRVVHDPATREALTPNFGPIAKRPTMSNGYLQAFNRPNIKLITTPIERFTKRGLRTRDGVEHPFDMIVLATGYHVFSDPETYTPGMVVGRDGLDLGRFYAEHGLQAYESVAVPGLPNRWMLVGPYSWTGSGWHAFVEMTADHAVRAITEARRRGVTSMEVRKEIHDAYHVKILKDAAIVRYYLADLNGHVPTYYRNSQGDSTYIRPTSFFAARRGSRHFPLDDYQYLTLNPGRLAPASEELQPSASRLLRANSTGLIRGRGS